MKYDILANDSFVNEVFGGSKELVMETLREFENTIKHEIDSLRSFISDPNCQCEDVRRTLHKLKPSLYYVGLNDVYQQTIKFMEDLNSEPSESMRADLGQYLQNLEDSVGIVRNYIAENNGNYF